MGLKAQSWNFNPHPHPSVGHQSAPICWEILCQEQTEEGESEVYKPVWVIIMGPLNV